MHQNILIKVEYIAKVIYGYIKQATFKTYGNIEEINIKVAKLNSYRDIEEAYIKEATLKPYGYMKEAYIKGLH